MRGSPLVKIVLQFSKIRFVWMVAPEISDWVSSAERRGILMSSIAIASIHVRRICACLTRFRKINTSSLPRAGFALYTCKQISACLASVGASSNILRRRSFVSSRIMKIMTRLIRIHEIFGQLLMI